VKRHVGVGEGYCTLRALLKIFFERSSVAMRRAISWNA
jgi:hypothetical protein